MKILQSVRKKVTSDDKKDKKEPAGHQATTSSLPVLQKSASGGQAQKAVSAGSLGSGKSGGSSAAKGTPRSAGSTAGQSVVENPFANLESLKDAFASEKPDVFRKTLVACTHMYDFTLPTHQKEKESKRVALLELVDYVNTTRNWFTESCSQEVFAMLSANVFRTISMARTSANRGNNPIYEPEEDEPSLEPAWPHLQIVYEFLLSLIRANEVDPGLAKKHFDHDFVLRLLELFDSEDPRERDYLKTVLHRIYGRFMALRAFIRKAIQSLFFKIIYESDTHNGIAELLEILGSIINGFALPLKDEHKVFLEKSLVPLHKVRSLAQFHRQLTYCMVQYVEKDPRLAEAIISGLLRFWPVNNTHKEVLFLTELEELLDLIQPAEFGNIRARLTDRLAKCVLSPHFQVAERALFMWNNEGVIKLMTEHRAHVFPVLIPALMKNSQTHWNSTVHGLTFNVLKVFSETDKALFDQVAVASGTDGASPQSSNGSGLSNAEGKKDEKWSGGSGDHQANTSSSGETPPHSSFARVRSGSTEQVGNKYHQLAQAYAEGLSKDPELARKLEFIKSRLTHKVAFNTLTEYFSPLTGSQVV